MESNKTKLKVSISIDRKLDEVINEEFTNKSKYIEWLIYQDLKKYSRNEKISKIIIGWKNSLKFTEIDMIIQKWNILIEKRKLKLYVKNMGLFIKDQGLILYKVVKNVVL